MLNNVQLAIVMKIVQDYNYLKARHPRQIWTIPAGYGKSRVIVGTIVGLSLSKVSYKNFQVVYNHRELLLEDKYRIVELTKDLDVKVTFVDAEKVNDIDVSQEGVFTIIDEVDSVLIDNNCFLT